MKKGIDKNSIISMAGIGLSLLALVIIFSQGTVFSFLTTAIVRPFGFVGFWILLPFVFILGLYMLLKQKLVKFRVGLSLWGLLIIILSLMILTSVWSEQTLIPGGELGFGSMSPTYVDALVNLGDNPYNTSYGGGLVGYFLAAILYDSVTKIGAQIICWLLIVVGICLVLNRQIKKLYLLIKNRNGKSSSNLRQDVSISEDDFVEDSFDNVPVTPVVNPNPAPMFAQNDDFGNRDLEMHNFNNTHGLKRATFSFDEDDGEEAMETASFNSSAPSFGAPVFNENENDFARPSYVEPEPFASNDDVYADDNDNIEPAFEEETAPIMPEVTPAVAPVVQQEIVEEKAPEPPVDKLHRPQPKANPIKNYIYPPITLLDYHENSDDAEKNSASTQETTDLINQIFENLHVGAQVVGATVGPCVTRYDVKTNSDVSVTTVARYVKDISIRLGGVPARFEELVQGKPTSGLEIPNAIRTTVGLRESIEKLPNGPKCLRYIPFGKNISGELLSANLEDFPHMLVSGTTGSGKTIFMHSVILSLIMRNKPDELKIVLIDPKKVEMAYYEQIPHLLCPNISQSNKAFVAMKKLVDEMERRYNLFAANRVRDIKGFNEFARANGIQPLPYIVVFIDEYADLVEEVKDIKTPVVRIAQKARAAGIHLVIATQRPSVNVIDGVIKANVSTRVALMVASQVDSISIINQAGAESLLGNGDMIVDCSLISRSLKPRVQGCFVDVPEINRVCDFLRSHYSEQYDPEFLDLEEHDNTPDTSDLPDVAPVDKDMAEEELYKLIKDQIVERDYCSISYIQRTYGVGFPKAGRLFNKLINDGYVARGGDARGSKVLIRSKEGQEQQMGTIEQSTFIPDPSLSGDDNLN